MRPTTPAHIATNIHPEYRYFGLSEISQLRLMIKSDRQQSEARQLIKRAQLGLARKRARLAAKSTILGG